jgi:hypothetical protein
MANENIDTKPTIETVLHRINAIGDRLSDEIHGLRGEIQAVRSEIQAVHDKLSGEIQAVRVEIQVVHDKLSAEIKSVHDKLSGEIQGVRNDLETFRLYVKDTLAYVAEDQIEVRSELRNMRRRVGELETKAT